MVENWKYEKAIKRVIELESVLEREKREHMLEVLGLRHQLLLEREDSQCGIFESSLPTIGESYS